MIKIFFIIALVFQLVGCKHSTAKDLLDDGAIGYTIISNEKNNKKLEIDIMLTEEETSNCINLSTIIVSLDDLGAPTTKEDTKLDFIVIDKFRKEYLYTLTPSDLSSEYIKQYIEVRDKFKTPHSRTFVISKDDLSRFLGASSILYRLKKGSIVISDKFSPDAYDKFKKYAPKLLEKKCYKGATNPEEDIKDGFKDFEAIRLANNKSDLEKYFGVKLNNGVKDKETGAYEHKIAVKIFGKGLGEIIVGFNDTDQIVYTRDPIKRSSISYRKNKKH